MMMMNIYTFLSHYKVVISQAVAAWLGDTDAVCINSEKLQSLSY